MANVCVSNTYEEARKQRLLENKKRFEDLGILKISKSLTEIKSEKSQQRQPKPRVSSTTLLEPRRSSRERKVVSSYSDDIGIDLPPLRRKSKLSSSWASYLARPADEVKIASFEEKAYAIKCAEKLKSNLQSECPVFIKSMVRSHVYSCFWLGLPKWFCRDHLPKSDQNVTIVLEDENGTEYEAIYICNRDGLSGGWRAFALDHKLDDGDALIFELVDPTRLKVYIVKASDYSKKDVFVRADEEHKSSKKMSTKANKKMDIVTRSKEKVKPTQFSSRKRKSNGSHIEEEEDNTQDFDEICENPKEIPTGLAARDSYKKCDTQKEFKATKPTRVSSRKRSSSRN